MSDNGTVNSDIGLDHTLRASFGGGQMIDNTDT